MPRDAVSRTANVERTGRHKWVYAYPTEGAYLFPIYLLLMFVLRRGELFKWKNVENKHGGFLTGHAVKIIVQLDF